MPSRRTFRLISHVYKKIFAIILKVFFHVERHKCNTTKNFSNILKSDKFNNKLKMIRTKTPSKVFKDFILSYIFDNARYPPRFKW